MKNEHFKNGLIVILLLLAGTTNAQETEIFPPSPPMVPSKVVEESAENDTDSTIVDFPDVGVEYPGGMGAMQKFIQENVEYPEEAREKGYQGRVYVTFIVEPDGSVSNIDVLSGGVHKSLNKEAMRLVRSMPKWSPGELNGKPVRSRCRLPITFTLEGDTEEVPKKKRFFRR